MVSRTTEYAGNSQPASRLRGLRFRFHCSSICGAPSSGPSCGTHHQLLSYRCLSLPTHVPPQSRHNELPIRPPVESQRARVLPRHPPPIPISRPRSCRPSHSINNVTDTLCNIDTDTYEYNGHWTLDRRHGTLLRTAQGNQTDGMDYVHPLRLCGVLVGSNMYDVGFNYGGCASLGGLLLTCLFSDMCADWTLTGCSLTRACFARELRSGLCHLH